MKKTVFTLFLMLAAFRITEAQTVEATKNVKPFEFVFASQVSTAEQATTLLDKIQKETEELILLIAPAPLVKLADTIQQKLEAAKHKKVLKKAPLQQESRTRLRDLITRN